MLGPSNVVKGRSRTPTSSFAIMQQASGQRYDGIPCVMVYIGETAYGPESVQSMTIDLSVGESGKYSIGSTESARLSLKMLSADIPTGIPTAEIRPYFGYYFGSATRYATPEEYEAAEDKSDLYTVDDCLFVPKGVFWTRYDMIVDDGLFTDVEAYDRFYWLTDDCTTHFPPVYATSYVSTGGVERAWTPSTDERFTNDDGTKTYYPCYQMPIQGSLTYDDTDYSLRMSPASALADVCSDYGITLGTAEVFGHGYPQTVRMVYDPSDHDTIPDSASWSRFPTSMAEAYAPSNLVGEYYISANADKGFKRYSIELGDMPDFGQFFSKKFLTTLRPHGTVREVIGQLAAAACRNAYFDAFGSLRIEAPSQRTDEPHQFATFARSTYAPKSFSFTNKGESLIDHLFCDFSPNYSPDGYTVYKDKDDKAIDESKLPDGKDWHAAWPPDGHDLIIDGTSTSGYGIGLDANLFNSGTISGCLDVDSAVNYKSGASNPYVQNGEPYTMKYMPAYVWADVVNLGHLAVEQGCLPVQYMGFEGDFYDAFHVEVNDRIAVVGPDGTTNENLLVLSASYRYDGGFTSSFSAEPVGESAVSSSSPTYGSVSTVTSAEELAKQASTILNSMTPLILSKTLSNTTDWTRPSGSRWYAALWQDGRLEYDIYYRTTGVNINATWGSAYYSTNKVAGNWNYPAAFSDVPMSVVNCTSGGGIFSSQANGTAAKCPKVWFTGFSSTTSQTCEMHMHVIGFVSDVQQAAADLGEDTMQPSGDTYAGPYDVTPMAYEAQLLNTKNLSMSDDVTVYEVPLSDVDNEYGGRTATIATDDTETEQDDGN